MPTSRAVVAMRDLCPGAPIELVTEFPRPLTPERQALLHDLQADAIQRNASFTLTTTRESVTFAVTYGARHAAQ